jgi:hypothetical protein
LGPVGAGAGNDVSVHALARRVFTSSGAAIHTQQDERASELWERYQRRGRMIGSFSAGITCFDLSPRATRGSLFVGGGADARRFFPAPQPAQ